MASLNGDAIPPVPQLRPPGPGAALEPGGSQDGDGTSLRVHELDAHAWGTAIFEAAGLIVAEREGRIVGFVHAGFGPDVPVVRRRPLQLSHEVGTVAMLIVEPGPDDHDIALGLLAAAEDYLRARGAKVLYAGGLFPLNPFYWGIYGGSEGTGILSGHQAFHAPWSHAATSRPARPCCSRPTSASPNRATPALR